MLIIASCVTVFCCVGASIGGYAIYRAVSSTAPAITATNRFFDDVSAGDYAAAYQHLCATTQASLTEEQFAATVQSQPHIRRHKVTGVSTATGNGVHTATVTTDLTYDSGAQDVHSVPLVREGGSWRVCGDPY